MGQSFPSTQDSVICSSASRYFHHLRLLLHIFTHIILFWLVSHSFSVALTIRTYIWSSFQNLHMIMMQGTIKKSVASARNKLPELHAAVGLPWARGVGTITRGTNLVVKIVEWLQN